LELYQVVDIKGHVIQTFPSKNQAEKYKKACKDHGMLGLKIIKMERR